MIVGDLVYIHPDIRNFGYPDCGIVVDMSGQRPKIAFIDGRKLSVVRKWISKTPWSVWSQASEEAMWRAWGHH